MYIYCNTITFPSESISNIFCNYLSTYDILTASTSYIGQVSHSFTPTIAAFTATSTSTVSSSTSASSLFRSSSILIHGTATATAAATGWKKPVDMKAAIGGIVGGLVSIILVGLAVWWFLRWRKTPYPEQRGGGKGSSDSEEMAVRRVSTGLSF
jgi:hypothetical protein